MNQIKTSPVSDGSEHKEHHTVMSWEELSLAAGSAEAGSTDTASPAADSASDQGSRPDPGRIRDARVKFCLWNYANNRKRLAYSPCIQVEDLAVVFIKEQYGRHTIVADSDLEEWNITLGDLFRRSLGSMVQNDPARLTTLSDAVGENEKEQKGREIPGLYVLSNTSGRYGAAVLLYPHVLHNIAEAWKEGFYIIPSSIHEVILIPKNVMIPIEDMRTIVASINRSELTIDEILSDEIYYYDPDRGRFSIASVQEAGQ